MDLELPHRSPATEAWSDSRLSVDARVEALLAEMTLDEKIAQLQGVWVMVEDGDGGTPRLARNLIVEDGPDRTPLEDLTVHGIGQLARVYGSVPVEPESAARALSGFQQELRRRTRLGIPALVHEECLTGVTAYRAAAFPAPLAWAATFDAATVELMARRIGQDLSALGVHQGLAPVLDVVRDARWGRVEETLGEDPYLVSVLATAYVRGLQDAGIIATAKHFAGYSGSRAGRNLAPVSIGPREFMDVVLPPFEMVLREGHVQSVMPSNADVDGVPPTADPKLLQELLRDEWDFHGLVVGDYFAVSYLHRLHGVASSPEEAAALALAAGVDVELPTGECFREPLKRRAVADPACVPLIDSAVRRVLTEKAAAGLLDRTWNPDPGIVASAPAGTEGTPADRDVRLDSAEHRTMARTIADRSVVLLRNGRGTLPLDPAAYSKIAVVGPCAHEPAALLGCYAFPNHVGRYYPESGMGIDVPTIYDALRERLARGPALEFAPGCDVSKPGTEQIAEAVRAAAGAQLCVAVLGDRAGLFGDGTSGEGCDVPDLELPGSQGELLEAVLGTGTPVVLVTVSGRPYATDRWAERLAGHVQAFFPGEEGGRAVAGVLLGDVNPSGRLPVEMPRHGSAQPSTYQRPASAGKTDMTAADPTPLYPFGHGLSYTRFEHHDLRLGTGQMATDGTLDIEFRVTNAGDTAGTDVPQLYLCDPVAQVARPSRQLLAFTRVDLPTGGTAVVRCRLHADRLAYTGRDLHRIVEPGLIHLLVGRSAEDISLSAEVDVVGPVRRVDHRRTLSTPMSVQTVR
ncbi:glycoside hydrolase family 3 N-terminal domain-containing protein [Actinomadura sp. B10D3]|uniref:glycoside hydrolase family 3 N-terminal domain-containing protein n=1 Tax=Actinomadura sp. B10D3 TaxID=3153557 RepID=UPI00325D164D